MGMAICSLVTEFLKFGNQAPYLGNSLFFLPLDKLQLDPLISTPFTKWSLVSNLINSVLN
jgi:hypothetical protein